MIFPNNTLLFIRFAMVFLKELYFIDTYKPHFSQMRIEYGHSFLSNHRISTLPQDNGILKFLFVKNKFKLF